MTLYIYWCGDNRHQENELIDQFTADTPEDCEVWAEEHYYDPACYFWNYIKN